MCDFQTATGRHSWWSTGADIVKGALRYVDNCTACSATRTRKMSK